MTFYLVQKLKIKAHPPTHAVELRETHQCARITPVIKILFRTKGYLI